MNKRKNLRIKEYDYSKEGYYFITICTQNRRRILSNINVGAGLVSAQINLTLIGKKIENSYLNLEKEFDNVKLHDYVIMPNHVHFIIEIYKRADTRPAPTISDIICSFKSRTTMLIINEIKINRIKPFNKRLWQRNYYEHIIRNEKEYLQIKEYIINNPLKWENDKYF
ncbi:MAG: transposase [Candidatus Scatovivens sp.]